MPGALQLPVNGEDGGDDGDGLGDGDDDQEEEGDGSDPKTGGDGTEKSSGDDGGGDEDDDQGGGAGAVLAGGVVGQEGQQQQGQQQQQQQQQRKRKSSRGGAAMQRRSSGRAHTLNKVLPVLQSVGVVPTKGYGKDVRSSIGEALRQLEGTLGLPTPAEATESAEGFEGGQTAITWDALLARALAVQESGKQQRVTPQPLRAHTGCSSSSCSCRSAAAPRHGATPTAPSTTSPTAAPSGCSHQAGGSRAPG